MSILKNSGQKKKNRGNNLTNYIFNLLNIKMVETELAATDKVVNIISLIIIIVDILIYLTFAKNLLKTKSGNTILFFTVFFGLVGGVVMLYLNSIASISLSSFIFLLLLFFVLRKKLSGGKIEGVGLTNYKSFGSTTNTVSRTRKRRRRK